MKVNRNLDGVYFRVMRDGKWKNICFSDMTKEEMEKVLDGRTEEWLKNLCIILGECIKEIGDFCDITRGSDDE